MTTGLMDGVLGLVVCGAAGYLLGSIPFALIVTRPSGHDLRTFGSKNIGATNVLRTGRRDLALLTLLLDGGKGALAVALAGILCSRAEAAPLAAGCLAVVGHNWPVWLGFRGGKGVATTFGVVATLSLPAAIVAAVMWIVVAAVTRYASVASLVSLAAAAVAGVWLTDVRRVGAFALLAGLAVLRHRGNIRRLWAGTESRVF